MLENAIRETADELGLSPVQVQQVMEKLLAKGVISYSVPAEEPPMDRWAAEFATVKQSIANPKGLLGFYAVPTSRSNPATSPIASGTPSQTT
jgi:predicted ArsR family transcriptional regulator